MPADHNMTPDAQTSGGMTADEMDSHHEAGIKAFLAGKETTSKGNQVLEPKMDGDVKVFELTSSIVQWEYSKGQKVEAWAYNEQVPGPVLRVTEGDKVRVIVNNKLPESTAVHFHGVLVPNNMDGVPFITQPPIKPGASFTYEFTTRNAGSHMYHSHHNATKQVGKGQLGAFIIDPKDKSKDPAFDAEYGDRGARPSLSLKDPDRRGPYTSSVDMWTIRSTCSRTAASHTTLVPSQLVRANSPGSRSDRSTLVSAARWTTMSWPVIASRTWVGSQMSPWMKRNRGSDSRSWRFAWLPA